jgi:PAT family acetyl-CoA transporter-like MFS transporter 1
MLFLMCATQDICVDGWALTLLQKRNVGYASTCNAIGQTLGNALAYIGWNVLTKYTDVTFGTFMMVWGVIFASVTVGVMLLKQEKDVSVEDEPPSYREAYKEMMDILKIPLVQKLILLLITCKVGFSSEAMSQIMMTGTVGMPRGDWVSLVLFLTVPSLIVPKLVERYTTGARPFDVFMKGVPPRILLGFATALVYMYAPTSFADDACTQWTREEQCVAPVSHPNSVEDAYTCTWSHGNGTCFSSHGTPEPSLFGLVPPRVWRHRIWYLSVVVIALVMTFLSNAMFVAQMSLFAKISDPRIGGTYMTLLNTVANLGSKWSSQAFRYCTDKADKYLAGNDVCAQWNDEMSCHAINRGSDPANDCGWSIMEKNHCTGVRWKMQTEKHEGFYVTLVVFSLFGLLWIKYVKKDVEEMQNKPLRDWHVHKLNEEERESVEL